MENRHRDFDISITCGMFGVDFEGEYTFKEFSTIELENLLPKADAFYRALLAELPKRPEYKEG